MRQTPEATWLELFNPCGMEVILGFVHQTCLPECEGRVCLRKTSYSVAGYLLEGADEARERTEVESSIVTNGLLGQDVVAPDGQVFRLNRENVPDVVDNIMTRGQRIVAGVRQCMENTEQVGPLTWENSPPDLQQVFQRVVELEEATRTFDGTRTQAVVLADQMQSALREAIDLGGGNLGVIARFALKFGLADQLPAVDSSGLVFVGNIEHLQPMR